MSSKLSVPTVTRGDLAAFHARTFGIAVPTGSLPGDDGDYCKDEQLYYEEDDGLGYYADGRKRTLTDEQIAMLRYSEIYNIIRKKELERENAQSKDGKSKDAEDANAEASQVSAMDDSVKAGSKDYPKRNSYARKKKRKLNKRQSFAQKDGLPSRRDIRGLDAVQGSEQVLDYD